MKDIVLINYGVPRTGTTFIQKALENVDCYSRKLTEWCRLHPIHSYCGLINLTEFFYDKKVLFIRTYRDPIEIMESHKAVNEFFGGYHLRDIARKIQSEEYFTNLQRKHNVFIYDINFDLFDKDSFLEHLYSFGVKELGELKKYLNNYKKVPVREGRLSLGIDSVLTSLERKEIHETFTKHPRYNFEP